MSTLDVTSKALYRVISHISKKPRVEVQTYTREKLESDLKLILGEIPLSWGNITGDITDQLDLQALLDALGTRIDNLEGNIYEVTYKTIIDISTGTTGSITFPTGAILDESEFPGNAILSERTGTQLDYKTPQTNGQNVTVNLSNSGTWIASTVYTGDVYLVYRLRVPSINYANLDNDSIVELAMVSSSSQTTTNPISPYTPIEDETIFIDASSGPKVVTLPSSPDTGFKVTIVKTDQTNNGITVTPLGGEPIHFDTSLLITIPQTSITLSFNGFAWYII